MQYSKGVLALSTLLCIQLCCGSTDLSNIEIRYGTVSYDPDGGDFYTSKVTVTNTGSSNIDSGSSTVSIYVCLIRLVIGSDEVRGVEVNTSPDITVYHLDGCAHKIVFSSPFQLESKTSISFTMLQKHWAVAYTDTMTRWYIQLGDGEYQLVGNTDQDQTLFVDPFDSKEKYMRTIKDKVEPFSLEDRYKEQTKLYPANDAEIQARLIPDVFDSLVDSQTQFTPVNNHSVNWEADASLKRGQFRFTVQDGDVEIKVYVKSTSSTEDINIATSTLELLKERFDNTLPIGTYTSKAPRFNYRGFMIDIARHFHGKEEIKRQLDLMKRYKLNVLHLHLADDESWALEIVDIPELTEVGSQQCFNLDECATYPQLGRLIRTREFLSKQDYIEIVQYAESCGIMVLPEIELPGHSTAAINAMKVRRKNDPTAVDYSLDDPADTSDYMSVQYFTQGAMNPCVDTMYTFVEKVIETIQSYHAEAGQNLTIIHLAGDEVADGAWINSPVCKELTADVVDDLNTRLTAIKVHMMQNLGAIAERFNLDLAFWEDGLINKTSRVSFVKDDVFPPTVDIYSFTWQTVWEWWGGDRAFLMANGGYKVVMTPATHFYMDHPYEPHPNEHGYYWATRYSSLERTFSFRPINYYANIDGTTVMGEPQTEASWCIASWKCPPLTRPENIVGVEATLFGETISTQEHIDNNAWPRLMAVAERAWNEGDWEKHNGTNPLGLLQHDFDKFRQAIEQYELPAIESGIGANVIYHISPPGANITSLSNGKEMLQLSVEFRGHRVWWRQEDSSVFTEAKDFKIEYTLDTKIYLKTSNVAATRYSYEVLYYKPMPAVAAVASSSIVIVSHVLFVIMLCINYV